LELVGWIKRGWDILYRHPLLGEHRGYSASEASFGTLKYTRKEGDDMHLLTQQISQVEYRDITKQGSGAHSTGKQEPSPI